MLRGFVGNVIALGGDTPTPPAFSPSLDFSDGRNSQYVELIF